VFTLGVFGGVIDKFPLGAVMNKALTLRGAQQHGQRYVPEILDRMSRDEVRTEHLATHVMSLDDGPKGMRHDARRRPGLMTDWTARVGVGQSAPHERSARGGDGPT
jgi:threonine dehydrogenase-like Zn-dependent dehydrogenase